MATGKVERAVSVKCEDRGIMDLSVDREGVVTVALTRWKSGKCQRSMAAITSLEDVVEAVGELNRGRVVEM